MIKPVDIMQEIVNENREHLYNKVCNLVHEEYDVKSAELGLLITHIILKILNENTEDFFK